MKNARTAVTSWLWLLPVTLFITTLVAAATAAFLTSRSIDAAAHARVQALTGDAAGRLLDRLENAGSVARGTAGLFSTEGHVTEESFATFVKAQSISQWFAEGRVSWVERDGASLAIRYVTPRSPVNDRNLGTELAPDDDRRIAMDEARDFGDPVLLSHFVSPSSPEVPRIAIIFPVYAGQPTTLEERRAAFKGAVTVGAERKVLMERALSGLASSFDLEVEDQAGLLLWRSQGFPSEDLPEGASKTLLFGGHQLTVRLFPKVEVAEPLERFAVLSILAVGTLLAFSFAGLTFQQLRGRRLAELAERLTRDALEEAERRRAMLDLVVEQSSDGIIMADARGALRLVNQASASLYGVEASAITPAMLEETPLRRALAGELVSESRWTVTRPNGEKRLLSGNASPLKNPDGTTAGAVMVVRDETVRHNAEAERESLILALEFSNADLEQFASVASHDLKAPLRGISQLAQWLEEDLTGKLNEENLQHFALLKGRVQRLVGLIEGILGYARAGQSSQTLESFDARDTVSEAVAMLAPPPGCEVVLPSRTFRINGDKALLTQALMNLVSNAFKHGPKEGGKVEVSVENDGSYVRFGVKDNGPGIAPEYHSRIWGMFQTLQPRDEKESTGIGLAVVRKVVQRQGGRAWLESAAGKGATFFFTWPRRPDA